MSADPGAPRLLFLSDEWRAAVRAMSAEQAGSVIDQPGLIVNATITGVPFGEGELELHSDRGPVVGWEQGHSPHAAFEIRVDYYLAKAIVLDATATAEALIQGFDSHGVEVIGDTSSYRQWWRARLGHAGAVELEDRIRAITA